MVKLVDNPQKTLSETQVGTLMDMVKVSERKDKTFFRNLRVIRDIIRGEQWKHMKHKGAEKVKVVINLAHAHIRSLVPTLYFKTPSVSSFPTNPIHEGKEKTWDGIINNTLDRIGFSDVMKEFALDACIYPEAWFKWVVNRPAPDSDKPGRKAERGGQSEEGMRGPTVWLEKGTPVPVRIAPNQVVMDYLAGTRRLDDARFVALRYLKTLAELKADPRYEVPKDFHPTTRSSMQAGGDTREDPFAVWDDGTLPETSSHDEMVTIYEVWVHQLVTESDTGEGLKMYQQVVTLMEGSNVPLRPPQSWEDVMGEGFNQYPFDKMELNPIADSLPLSEVELWKDLQIGTNWIMSRILGLVENEKMIYEMDKNKMVNVAAAKKAIMGPAPKGIVEVNEPNALQLIQPTFVGRDNYQALNLLGGYIMQVSGLGQNRKGGSGIRTATEAHLVEQGTQIKTDEKVDNMQRTLTRIINKMTMIIRSLVKNDEGLEWVFRVKGDTGSINWLRFSREDIDWHPDVTIDVDSFRKRDDQEEAQRAMMKLNTGMQMFQILGPAVRLDILFRSFLEAMGESNPGKIIDDQTEDVIAQSAELTTLVLGIPTNVNPDDNHAVHIRILDMFRNSQSFQQLGQANPAAMDAIEQHYAQHEQALQEAQQQAGGSGIQGPNGYDDINPEAGSPANQARSLTQANRPEAVPGGAGQF